MPRKSGKIPSYCRHKAIQQAVVRLDGRDRYLGPYGSDASYELYERLVGEWRVSRQKQAAGKRASAQPTSRPAKTVNDVLLAYLTFARTYDAKEGKPTQEYQEMTYALRPVRKLYGKSSAATFGPLALKAVREHMIDDGLCRGLINSRVNRIKRAWKWAVSEELLPPGASRGGADHVTARPAESQREADGWDLPPEVLLAARERLPRVPAARDGRGPR